MAEEDVVRDDAADVMSSSIDAELIEMRGDDELIAKLDALTKEVREHTSLLKSLLVYARRQAERVEPRKTRR